jgi:hypothetical protein
MRGLENVLKVQCNAEKQAGTFQNVRTIAVAEVQTPKVSPPVRGATSELEAPSLLQWLQQCVTAGHYWSEPEEAATFLFSYPPGHDWVTWLWHTIMFSGIYQTVSCGACPRFRRLGNSYVSWRGGKMRKLRGTPPSDDELGTLKMTFTLVAFGALPAIVLMMSTELVGGVSGYSLMPSPYWYGGVGIAASCGAALFAVYFALVVAGLTLWPQTLVGTRPASLPSFMSLLVRTTAPQFMISYSWGGDHEQGLLGLAHGLAEVLPDCWIDVRRLTPGQRLVDEVRNPAMHARVLIILMNRAYVNSINCGHELLAAVMARKRGMHRTVVLIEAPDEVRGYSPRWKEISELLERAGFDVVRSIDGADGEVRSHTGSNNMDTYNFARSPVSLLEYLDRRACRHDFKVRAEGEVSADVNEKDARATMAWFATYADGIAAATASAQDLRLPWNFFIKPTGNIHHVRQDQGLHLKTVNLFSNFSAYMRGLCWLRRPPMAVSTGHTGYWIPANASEEPAPHVAVPVTLLASLMIGLFIAVALSVILFLFLWYNAGLSGGDLLLYVLNELGAATLVLVFLAVLLIFFMARWGDVLTAPGSQLHSPELFVPLLVRELNLLLPQGSDIKLKVRFIVPRAENSNCRRVATNISALLKCARFDSEVMVVDKAGVFGNTPHPDFDANTVSVLMLEDPTIATAWVDSQHKSGARFMRPEQVVLVASSGFLSAHPELYEWLIIEFAETGMDPRLTPSGTASGLSLASQILNAVSMKLVGLLATRKLPVGDEAATGSADRGGSASPRSAAAAEPVRGGGSASPRSPKQSASPPPTRAARRKEDYL